MTSIEIRHIGTRVLINKIVKQKNGIVSYTIYFQRIKTLKNLHIMMWFE